MHLGSVTDGDIITHARLSQSVSPRSIRRSPSGTGRVHPAAASIRLSRVLPPNARPDVHHGATPRVTRVCACGRECWPGLTLHKAEKGAERLMMLSWPHTAPVSLPSAARAGELRRCRCRRGVVVLLAGHRTKLRLVQSARWRSQESRGQCVRRPRRLSPRVPMLPSICN